MTETDLPLTVTSDAERAERLARRDRAIRLQTRLDAMDGDALGELVAAILDALGRSHDLDALARRLGIAEEAAALTDLLTEHGLGIFTAAYLARVPRPDTPAAATPASRGLLGLLLRRRAPAVIASEDRPTPTGDATAITVWTVYILQSLRDTAREQGDASAFLSRLGVEPEYHRAHAEWHVPEILARMADLARLSTDTDPRPLARRRRSG